MDVEAFGKGISLEVDGNRLRLPEPGSDLVAAVFEFDDKLKRLLPNYDDSREIVLRIFEFNL